MASAQAPGPLTRLLEALSAGTARRAVAGWPHVDLAERALAAARTTVLGSARDGESALGNTGTLGRADDAAPGRLDPLARTLPELARHAGLDPVESALLTAALASEIDQNLHLLTGLLSGDDSPQRPTVALALELAGMGPAERAGRRALAELGPLRRHGLLRVTGDGPLLARRLAVADRPVAHLLGDDTPATAIAALLTELTPVEVPGYDRVAAALRAGHPLAWVHSPPGAAGPALAAAACRELDVPYLAADLGRLVVATGAAEPHAADVVAAIDALITEATLAGSVLILLSAELAGAHADRLVHAALPLIAVGSIPWDPAWPTERLPVSVTSPRISTAIRAALWSPILGTAPALSDDPAADIAALRLTPGDIMRVSRAALDDAALGLAGDQTGGPSGTVTAEHIRRSARRLGRNRSSKFQASTEPATLDDLVLPEHVKSEVARLLDWARYRDEVLAQGPLQGKGGKGTGICALFAGSPGTGKSLAAHVVADTLGMDLYSVDISSMVDKYIGETEKNLERVFTEAESLNAVLFFDEADSLFGSRSEVRDSRDRYANQEVAYLLQRMEQFDGITVLATNLRGNLDPAFSRRLHFVIHFPDPDEDTRARLWTHHLANLATTDPRDPIDIGVLARDMELAGGDIRNIVLSAAYAAAAERSPTGMRHVTAAAVREYSKLGRRVPAAMSSAHHDTSEAAAR
jgi:AAA+ superfamily predicted ATPase